MSDHQETLAQVVERIEASFDKIKALQEKARPVPHLGRQATRRTPGPHRGRRSRHECQMVGVVRGEL